MTIRPGRKMLWLFGAMIAVTLLSQFWIALLWGILFLLCALLVGGIHDFIQLRNVWAEMKVSQDALPQVERGDPFALTVKVASKCVIPIAGEVRSVLPAQVRAENDKPVNDKENNSAFFWHESFTLAPKQESSFVRTLSIPIRGLYELGPVWLRLSGTYGMIEAQKKFDCLTKVKVVPDSAASRESLRSNKSDSDMLKKMSHNRLTGIGMEFESLTEFKPGDDPRRIDWRTSARCRDLVVRRYHIEQHRDVMVVLDCGRLMGTAAGKGTKLDRSVDSALMLCQVALNKGDRCGLALFDSQVLGYLPPISGRDAYRAIVERVYNVQSRWQEPNFAVLFAALQSRQQKRALVVVLSDITDAATSSSYRAALVHLARRHLVVFAALRTPLLTEIVRNEVREEVDIYKSAVAFRLMRDREKALHELSRAGVHVLDVEPRNLTVPLVNQYISLRERNLL